MAEVCVFSERIAVGWEVQGSPSSNLNIKSVFRHLFYISNVLAFPFVRSEAAWGPGEISAIMHTIRRKVSATFAEKVSTRGAGIFFLSFFCGRNWGLLCRNFIFIVVGMSQCWVCTGCSVIILPPSESLIIIYKKKV